MGFTREDTLPKPSLPAAPLHPGKPRRSRRVRASHGTEPYVAARWWGRWGAYGRRHLLYNS